MLFQSPIWLLLLLPWTGLVVYLLNGRGVPAVVPFLPFWRGSVTQSRRPARRRPPLFVLLMLMSMLLAILAAAHPVLRSNRPAAGDVTVILDCGASMARPSRDGQPFRGGIDRADQMLGPITGRVEIICVPGPRLQTSGSDWAVTAKSSHPTAIPVSLDQAISEQLHRTNQPVVVLSDQRLSIVDARIVQIRPVDPAPAIVITRLAASEKPRPQVMVRLENHSALTSVRVRIASGAIHVERSVQLHPSNDPQDEFFDVPSLDRTVSAVIDSSSADDPWATAWLVRQSAGIRIATIGELPEAVEKMIAVYAKDRAPNEGAEHAFVSSVQLKDSQPGIWFNANAGDVRGTTVVSTASITRDVKTWPAQGPLAALPQGFTPVVKVGDVPIAAIREQPVRQIWITGNLQEWSRSIDFVVFFANALDWIASQDQHFSSTTPAMLGRDWKSFDAASQRFSVPPGAWPGLYHSDAGRLLAINAGAYPETGSADDVTDKSKLITLKTQDRSLVAPTVFVALLILLLAAFFFPSAKERAKSLAETPVVRYSQGPGPTPDEPGL